MNYRYLACLAIVAIAPLFAQVVQPPTPRYVPPPQDNYYYYDNQYPNSGVRTPYHYGNPYGGYGYHNSRPYYYENQRPYKQDRHYHHSPHHQNYHNYGGCDR